MKYKLYLCNKCVSGLFFRIMIAFYMVGGNVLSLFLQILKPVSNPY